MFGAPKKRSSSSATTPGTPAARELDSTYQLYSSDSVRSREADPASQLSPTDSVFSNAPSTVTRTATASTTGTNDSIPRSASSTTSNTRPTSVSTMRSSYSQASNVATCQSSDRHSHRPEHLIDRTAYRIAQNRQAISKLLSRSGKSKNKPPKTKESRLGSAANLVAQRYAAARESAGLGRSASMKSVSAASVATSTSSRLTPTAARSVVTLFSPGSGTPSTPSDTSSSSSSGRRASTTGAVTAQYADAPPKPAVTASTPISPQTVIPASDVTPEPAPPGSLLTMDTHLVRDLSDMETFLAPGDSNNILDNLDGSAAAQRAAQQAKAKASSESAASESSKAHGPASSDRHRRRTEGAHLTALEDDSRTVLSQSTQKQVFGHRLRKSSTASRRVLNYKYFEQLALKARPVDALIYALPRKEAWIQYSTSEDARFANELLEVWAVNSVKYVLHGSLLFSPGKELMKDTSLKPQVLDIQGYSKPQWSWQLALDFPNAEVYGYRLRAHDPLTAVATPAGEPTGPANYTPVEGENLWQMPFEDNTFDIISARNLWQLIKSEEWIITLAELRRVLKPGGYLEVTVTDFKQLNLSPVMSFWWQRLAQSVASSGYEVEPSKYLIQRMNSLGFESIRRAWIALPRGWGGQIGHLFDFLGAYMITHIFDRFGNWTPEETRVAQLENNKPSPKGVNGANSMIICYGRKPLSATQD
ncbi:uncharacterized protein V1510DRAFT_397819 [Dipodascopsis tothii]|uniref:uncharacterized protein n=1 Tax=Dipodascopsis tothii TaxID=44089 RepID=UPI0034CF0C4B